MIKLIKKWFNDLFCDHIACRHIRNIGGDEQMHHYVKGGGLAKSEWACCDCNILVYKNHRVNKKMTIEEIRKNAPKGSQYYIECLDGIIYFKYRWGRAFKWNSDIFKFVLYSPKCSIHDLAKPLH